MMIVGIGMVMKLLMMIVLIRMIKKMTDDNDNGNKDDNEDGDYVCLYPLQEDLEKFENFCEDIRDE